MEVTTVFVPTPHTKSVIHPWLEELLKSPTYSGRFLPTLQQTMGCYINNGFYAIVSGAWEVRDRYIYLASNGAYNEPLNRLAILSTIANLCDLHSEPIVQTLFSEALSREILSSSLSVWANLVMAHKRPEKFAVSQPAGQIAAQLDGEWVAPNGSPVKVDDSWIIMDV